MNKMSTTFWKENWLETKERFTDWWNRKGLLIGMWGAPETGQFHHDQVALPQTPESKDSLWCDPVFRANQNRYQLARSVFPADVLPMANTDLGPGSLALFCGSRPEFGTETVWFHPQKEGIADPADISTIQFDPQNPWWQLTEEIIKRNIDMAQGQYLVGCPDLVENADTLCSLCGPEFLCTALIEHPEWVEQRISEINQLWFEAYQRIYDLIREEDGSSAFATFYLWAPGKVAKVQCDFSAMISSRMYRRFVAPALTAQCEWLDYSLYHLDGTQAMRHLDTLLEIEALDAIEWTPQAGIETGGDPRWYELYRRILDAGKSVQVVNVEHHEVLPLLDAIGTDGVYILTTFTGQEDAEALLSQIPANVI